MIVPARVAIVALLLSICASAAAAQAPVRPIVRASLDPARNVTVGEPVSLVVEILVPTFFMQAPVLPAIAIPGAAATLEDAVDHTNEAIGGSQWAGIRRRYRIVAQAPGAVHVPPVNVVVRYGIDGKLSDPFTISTPALSFSAVLPPGAEDLDYFFAARDLRLTERFDRRPAALRLGDAFVRTVTIAADGVTALELPPVAVTAPDGVRLHADPPALSPAPAAGALGTASRMQTFTYTTSQPGHYTLPAVEVRYWNLAERRVRAVSLAPVTFDVEGTAAFGEEIALPPDPDTHGAVPTRKDTARWWMPITVAILVLIAGVWLIRRYRTPLTRAWQVSRVQDAQSERRYFQHVKTIARRGDLGATHAAVLAWLTRLPSAGPAPSLTQVVETYGDAALARDVTQMTRTLYAPEPGAVNDPRFTKRLAAGLSRARRRLLAQPRRVPGRGARPLSPLNP